MPSNNKKMNFEQIPSQEKDIRARVMALYKRCAPDIFPPNIRKQVETDATVLIGILNEVKSLKSLQSWPDDFSYKVGTPLRLVGTLDDGRIVFSKREIPLQETPEAFLKQLEYSFGLRDDSKDRKKSSPQEASREKKNTRVETGTREHSMEFKAVLQNIEGCDSVSMLGLIASDIQLNHFLSQQEKDHLLTRAKEKIYNGFTREIESQTTISILGLIAYDIQLNHFLDAKQKNTLLSMLKRKIAMRGR